MPTARATRTTLRTAHLLAFGALYGGALYGVPAERLLGALIATVATGLAFMLFEIWRVPVFVMQVRGLATLLKILLLVAAHAVEPARVVLLTTAAILGAVSSHMPGSYRYYSVFHGRVLGSQEKG